MDKLPSGTVTFLFTDIESSTRLWQERTEAMRLVHERHDEILRQAIQSNNGYVFQIVGDSFSAAFHNAMDGLNAALAAQRKLYTEVWGETGMIKVRMGLHTGTAEILPDGKYDGYTTLATTQRIMSVACGSQVLLSQATYELCHHYLHDDINLRDVGEHRLKDIKMLMRLYQLATPDLPGEFPPIKSLSTVSNNIPAQLTSFIGREKQLADSSEEIAHTRMLTFIGPGGTGKTRLSLQLAEDQLPNFKDGAWFVELAPLTDSAYVVSTIASTFKLREVQGVPLLTTLMDYLRDKQLLLILDNCEHLVEACAQLADQLLHECPNLKIVASSREALGINGETVYRVPSLKEEEATRLFIERANKADSRFQATEDNVSFIGQICVHLDGIPLAIELAAARVMLFSPQQISERLDDRFKLLTGGSRTALPRQQTLRALIDWSYQTLNELEQRTLRQLAVFSGGWTFEAAEVVVGDSEAFDGLAGLVNKSLVTVEEQSGASRYSFLETIRQYAMEKLLESGEAITARDRHFEYFLAFADRVNEQLVHERKKKWFDLLELENDNLRSALRWSIAHDPLKATKLIRCMTNFWLAGGYLAEGQVWCDSALSRLEAHSQVDSDTNLARAHGYSVAAILSNNQGEHRRARAFLEKAIPVFQQANDTKELARSLIVLATAFGFSGEIEQAFKTIHECIRISRENRNKFELAWSLSALSHMTFEFHGPVATSEIDAYMQESIALMQEINHPWGSFYATEYLSRRAFVQGDIETALHYANQVLTDFQEAGATLLANNYKSGIAHVLRQMGNLAEAIPMYRETILVYQDLGHRGAIAHQLESFAFIAKAQEQSELAIQLLGAAEALREVSKSRMTPPERTDYNKQLTELRTGIDEEDFTRLWAEGRAMSIEQAIDRVFKIPISP